MDAAIFAADLPLYGSILLVLITGFFGLGATVLTLRGARKATLEQEQRHNAEMRDQAADTLLRLQGVAFLGALRETVDLIVHRDRGPGEKLDLDTLDGPYRELQLTADTKVWEAAQVCRRALKGMDKHYSDLDRRADLLENVKCSRVALINAVRASLEVKGIYRRGDVRQELLDVPGVDDI